MDFSTLVPSRYSSKARATLVLVFCLAIFAGQWGTKTITTGHLVGLVIAAYLIWELKSADEKQSSTFNEEMELRLARLDPDNQYPYLLVDFDLVYLLYISLPLQINNEGTFAQMMQTINSYLESISIIQCSATEDPSTEFESLRSYQNLACNLYHSLIYQLDDNSNLKDLLYQRCLDKIRVRFNHQLTEIRKGLAQKQARAPVSIRTTFLQHLNRPQPLNVSLDTSLIERNFKFF